MGSTTADSVQYITDGHRWWRQPKYRSIDCVRLRGRPRGTSCATTGATYPPNRDFYYYYYYYITVVLDEFLIMGSNFLAAHRRLSNSPRLRRRNISPFRVGTIIYYYINWIYIQRSTGAWWVWEGWDFAWKFDELYQFAGHKSRKLVDENEWAVQCACVWACAFWRRCRKWLISLYQ